jgi:hypothetical protein
MTIYEFVTSGIPTAAGSVSSTTLKIQGGLLRQMLVRANTASTVFKVNLSDDNSTTRLNYGFHTGEINDTGETGPLPFLNDLSRFLSGQLGDRALPISRFNHSV